MNHGSKGLKMPFKAKEGQTANRY